MNTELSMETTMRSILIYTAVYSVETYILIYEHPCLISGILINVDAREFSFHPGVLLSRCKHVRNLHTSDKLFNRSLNRANDLEKGAN